MERFIFSFLILAQIVKEVYFVEIVLPLHQRLSQVLKPGGRMCIPAGTPFKVQHLVLIEKGQDRKLITTIIGSVRFVLLVRDKN